MSWSIAIMQPYFLPYVGYFHLIEAVDEFVFFDDVNYIKRGWINRNNFLVQGKAHLFSVSVVNASQNDLIKDVRVNYTEKWKDNFIKILKFNYSKTKNFQIVFDMVQNELNKDHSSIADLNISLIECVCSYLELNKTFKRASSINYDKISGAEGKILSICTAEHATKYINPIGGTGLYDKMHFTEKGFTLNFVQSKPVEYVQVGSKEFVPNLSILDLLMFCDINEARDHLKKYSLI